jgi:hypothetical protein
MKILKVSTEVSVLKLCKKVKSFIESTKRGERCAGCEHILFESDLQPECPVYTGDRSHKKMSDPYLWLSDE